MSARRRSAPSATSHSTRRTHRGRTLALTGLVVLVLGAAAWWALEERPAVWPEAVLPDGNVLIVTIDTLRADRLTSRVMPALSALAATGHMFTTAYTHAPLTLPAHASIFTGLRPPAHGVRGNGAFRLADNRVTLAERLRDAGRRTGAFVGSFVLDQRFGLGQGFDDYSGVPEDRPFAQDFAFAQRRADAVLDDAARWILEGPAGQPWFAWVHLFDPHAPYDAPDAPGTLAPYDAEAHYADRELAAFLDRLRQNGQLARTLLIVTADHGESLGEHGEQTHGLFAYDATMRVPLVVSGPGLGAGTHQQPAAHIDIVPTVIDVLGLPADPSLPGRSLRLVAAEGSDARAVYLEAMDGWLTAGAAPVTAIVSEGWKLVQVPQGELYHLTEDHDEMRNLWNEEPVQRRALASLLEELHVEAAPLATAPRDGDAEARLRALGYASGGPPSAAGALTEADDPKVVLPLYERFLSLLGEGTSDPDALLSIVRERPSFHAARLAAASLLIELGRADEAVAALEPMASSPGASLALRERLGAALLADRRFDRAREVLSHAVTDPGASADAWNALGVAHASLGDADQARVAFDRAVALAPSAARLRFNRILAQLDAGDVARAETDLVTLTRDSPGMTDGWRLLATVRHSRGDLDGAIDAWRRVSTQAPEDTDTMFNLAVTLQDLGRVDEARTWARRFLAAVPVGSHPAERQALAGLGR